MSAEMARFDDVFSSGNGNLISVADVDAASGNLQVTLGVSSGTLTLGIQAMSADSTARPASVQASRTACVSVESW